MNVRILSLSLSLSRSLARIVSAFAVNYGLHLVGRRELVNAYPDDLKCRVRGHYHDEDTQESFLSAARDAVATLRKWCDAPEQKRGPWATTGLDLRDC